MTVVSPSLMVSTPCSLRMGVESIDGRSFAAPSLADDPEPLVRRGACGPLQMYTHKVSDTL